jgi:hypothetical protein
MKTSSLAYLHSLALSQFAAVLVLGSIISAHAQSSIALEYPIEFAATNHLQNSAPQNAPSPQPSGNSTGSGVAWWPARNSYLILDNNPRRLIEFSRNHAYIRTITLDGFLDPESIDWMYGNTFVIAQERHALSGPDSVDELVVITLPGTGDDTASITDPGVRRLTINTDINTGGFVSADNAGIEAVTLLGTNFYFTTETAPGSPANAWNVWTVPYNAPSGTVTPVAAFNLSALLSGRANDISGMATDGTDLWLLSDDGNGVEPGRLIKVTTNGTLLADYLLPRFGDNSTWNQAEGVDLFMDPVDLRLKILITGEIGPTSTSVDFMLLTAPGVKLATVNATGGWLAYPFLNGGGSQLYHSTASAVDTNGLPNPAPMNVYQRLQPEYSTLTVNSLSPATVYRVRVHLSSIQFTGWQNVSQDVWVSNGGSPNWVGNVTPFAFGFNEAMIVDLGQIYPSASGQLFVGITPTAPGKIVVVSGVEVWPD